MVTAHQLRSIWTASVSARPAERDDSELRTSVLPRLQRCFIGLGHLPRRDVRRAVLAAALLVVVVWSAVPQIMAWLVRPECHFSLASVPDAPVALVLGAGITPHGRLSPVLRERVNAAVALYRAGKVRCPADDRRQRAGDAQRAVGDASLRAAGGHPGERDLLRLRRVPHLRFLLPGAASFRGGAGRSW